MAAVERLVGLGMPPELAKRIGFFVQATDGGDTLHGPANYFIKASGGSVNLAADFDLGDVVVVAASTTCHVSPDSGSKIGLQTTASAAVVTTGVTRSFWRFSNTEWWVMSSV